MQVDGAEAVSKNGEVKQEQPAGQITSTSFFSAYPLRYCYYAYDMLLLGWDWVIEIDIGIYHFINTYICIDEKFIENCTYYNTYYYTCVTGKEYLSQMISNRNGPNDSWIYLLQLLSTMFIIYYFVIGVAEVTEEDVFKGKKLDSRIKFVIR